MERDEIKINLTRKSLKKYKKLEKHFKNNSIVLSDISVDRRLLCYLIIRKINNDDSANIDWGYNIYPERSIPLDELKKIKFVENLNETLDSSWTTLNPGIAFAIIGNIMKHYNEKVYMLILGESDKDCPPDLAIYI